MSVGYRATVRYCSHQTWTPAFAGVTFWGWGDGLGGWALSASPFRRLWRLLSLSQGERERGRAVQFAARFLSTYWRMPPWRKYSSSLTVSIRQRVANRSVLPSARVRVRWTFWRGGVRSEEHTSELQS